MLGSISNKTANSSKINSFFYIYIYIYISLYTLSNSVLVSLLCMTLVKEPMEYETNAIPTNK